MILPTSLLKWKTDFENSFPELKDREDVKSFMQEFISLAVRRTRPGTTHRVLRENFNMKYLPYKWFFCSKCNGDFIKEKDVYCPRCGSLILGEKNQEPEEKKKSIFNNNIFELN